MSKPEHADALVIGAGASGAIQSLVLAQAGFPSFVSTRAAGRNRASIRITARIFNTKERIAGIPTRLFGDELTIIQSRASNRTL